MRIEKPDTRPEQLTSDTKDMSPRPHDRPSQIRNDKHSRIGAGARALLIVIAGMTSAYAFSKEPVARGGKPYKVVEYTYSGNKFVLPHRATRGRQIQIFTVSPPRVFPALRYFEFHRGIRIGVEIFKPGSQPTPTTLLLVGTNTSVPKYVHVFSFIDVGKSILEHALYSAAREAVLRNNIRESHDAYTEFRGVDTSGAPIKITFDDIFSRQEQSIFPYCLWLPKVVSIYSHSSVARFSILLPQKDLSCYRVSSFSGTDADFGIDDKEVVFRTWGTLISLPLTLNSSEINSCRYLIDYRDYHSIAESVLDKYRKEISPYSSPHFDELGMEEEIERKLQAFVNSAKQRGSHDCHIDVI